VNSEGLRRRGFSAEQIQNVRRAYRTIYRSGLSLEKARRELAEMEQENGEITLLTDFLDNAERSIIR
jgi:UDP-N-acetylglucosamine acyltransferase